LVTVIFKGKLLRDFSKFQSTTFYQTKRQQNDRVGQSAKMDEDENKDELQNI
jgi:hypothetical protein